MPTLWAACNPLSIVPAFLVPVFIERERSNALLLQAIGPTGRVIRFMSQSDVPTTNIAVPPRRVERGDPALWVFAFSAGEVLVGTESEIRPRLAAELASGCFAPTPMLQLEIARFVGRARPIDVATNSAYRFLQDHSRISADVWRDSDVLEPEAKRSVAGWLRKTGRRRLLPAVSAVAARSSGSGLRVELPHELAALTSDEAFRVGGLEGLRALGRAVGIKRLSLVRGVGYVVDRRIPYGIVRGLSDMPARRTRAHHRTLELRAWPNLPVGTVPEGRILHSPAFAFVVLRQDDDLAAAWEAAEDWQDWNVCTCALVVRNADAEDGVGDVEFRLRELTAKFDFVFSISNHLPQRPVPHARSEAVEQRGTRSAEACITGMLDLADAMDVTSREEFVRKVRSRGVALFGSAVRRAEQSGVAAVDAAMASTREPVSQLTLTDVLLLAAPGLLLKETTVPRLREFRQVGWGGKSSLVRVFAFGLKVPGIP